MVIRLRECWGVGPVLTIQIGVEVSISGWLTTYLVRERGANANAGFAVTGFWGGMTVGRIVLIPFTNKVGYQFSIYF